MALAHVLLTADSSGLDNSAIVDCAADYSLYPDPDGYDAYESVAAGVLDPCVAADGSVHDPIGHGIRVKRIALEDGRSLLLPIYYRCVPAVGFELVATSALTDLGLKIEITDDIGLRIITNDGGAASTCANSPEFGKLYLLNELPLDKQHVREALEGRAASIARVFITARGRTTDLKARKTPVYNMRRLRVLLGYPSESTVRKLASQLDMAVDSDTMRSNINTTTNMRARTLRQETFPTAEQYQPGQLLILDYLGEKHPRSVDGAQYACLHVDMSTRLAHYSFHGSKCSQDLTRGFKDFVRLNNLPVDVDNGHLNQGVQVSVDGAGSFKGCFDDFADHVGINKVDGSAYVHDTAHLNVVEYMHRTLQYRARVSIAQCKQVFADFGLNPMRFWNYFLANAVQQDRYLPSAWHDGKCPVVFTPGRNLRPVSIAELQNWFPVPCGSRAWILRSEDKRRAMADPQPHSAKGVKQWLDRATPMLFLGCTAAGKYILYNPRTFEFEYSVAAVFSDEGIDYGYAKSTTPPPSFDEFDWTTLRATSKDSARPGPSFTDSDSEDSQTPFANPDLHDLDDEQESALPVPAVQALGEQTPAVPHSAALPAAPTPHPPTASTSNSAATHLNFDNASTRRSGRGGGHASSKANDAAAAMLSSAPRGTPTRDRNLQDRGVAGRDGGYVPPADQVLFDDDVPDIRLDIDNPDLQQHWDTSHLSPAAAMVARAFVTPAVSGTATKFHYDNGDPAPTVDTPSSINAALDGPMGASWLEAWDQELRGVKDRLKPVKLRLYLKQHPRARVWHSTVVCKVKTDVAGDPDRLKLRVVIIGTPGEKGRDYHEKLCSTPRPATNFMCENIAAEQDLNIASSDCVQCFLQGEFQDSEGLEDNAGIMRLPKRLREFDLDGDEIGYVVTVPTYGLIQAANAWQRTLQGWLLSDDNPIPMKRSNFDSTMFCFSLPTDKSLRQKALQRLQKLGINVKFTTKASNRGKTSDPRSPQSEVDDIYYFTTWIDDGRHYFSNTKMHDLFMQKFSARFKVTGGHIINKGAAPELYLGNLHTYSANGARVEISSAAKVDRILDKYEMSTCKGSDTFMDVNVKLGSPTTGNTPGEKCSLVAYLTRQSKKGSESWFHPDQTDLDQTNFSDVVTRYRSALMSISHLAQTTYPELKLPVSILAQYQVSPTVESWKCLKHLFRYLQRSKNEAMVFSKTGKIGLTLSHECDAAHGQDLPWHGGSRYATITRLNGGASIESIATRTKSVCIGTLGSEIFALSCTARTCEFYRMWLFELGWDQALAVGNTSTNGSTTIKCDNAASILNSHNNLNSDRSRHLCLRWLKIRESTTVGNTTNPVHQDGNTLCPDMLTKPLNGEKLKSFKRELKQGLTQR